jgi:hypothetical protein
MGKMNQAVGLAAHGGNHHHDLMPLSLVFCYALRNILDALWTADRSAAVFLNYQCHDMPASFFMRAAF